MKETTLKCDNDKISRQLTNILMQKRKLGRKQETGQEKEKREIILGYDMTKVRW